MIRYLVNETDAGVNRYLHEARKNCGFTWWGRGGFCSCRDSLMADFPLFNDVEFWRS
jgi:hypothetical protein